MDEGESWGEVRGDDVNMGLRFKSRIKDTQIAVKRAFAISAPFTPLLYLPK